MNCFKLIIIKSLEWLLITLLGTMVLLVFTNVVLRYFFNSGLVFAEELSRFVFMWLTFFGALLAVIHRAHLGMNSVISSLPIIGQRIFRFLSDLIVLTCCLLLSYGTYQQIILAMDDKSPVIGIPMGLVFAALLLVAIGICITLIFDLWQQISGKMPAHKLVNRVNS